jgi:hypothetical protein
MGTFVNDSGVIIASYNNEVIRFEKDGLQIFTDNKNVVLVSIQQNQRIERRYPASEISSPSNSGADDLKRKLFLMLEDYGAGGGGVTDLQGAYDGGNVVNGVDLIFVSATQRIAIGEGALDGADGNALTAIGRDAGKNHSGGSGHFILGEDVIPSYNDLASAQSSITIANGFTANSRYLILDDSDLTVKVVIPA